MRLCALALVIAACTRSHGYYPVQVGGGPGPGGTGGGGVDAAVTGDGQAMLQGKVCLLTDLRTWTSCAPTGAGGLTVTLDAATATTADDGSFTIAQPTSSNLTWQVTGSNLMTSLVAFSLSGEIPAVSMNLYNDFAGTNGTNTLTEGMAGILFARVLRAGAPLVGVTGALNPIAQYATFYDGNSALQWNQSATGPLGVLYIAGAMAGATLQLTPSGGTATSIPGITIADNELTFVTVTLP